MSSPILEICLVAKNVFPQPIIVYLTVYASAVWYELVWEGKCGLNSLINPTVLAWLSFVVSFATCELASVPYSLWESRLAWGW